MRKQIIEKLANFLGERTIIKEEFEVVYLMVELRKLLDQERELNNSSKYPLVRFHADWVVHTKKEKITNEIKEIITNIGNNIDVYPKNGDVSFLLLPEFRKELTQILKDYQLPHGFCLHDGEWLSFMLVLTQVIADQPIVNPTDDVAEFRYVYVKDEAIMANIDFRGARAGQSITVVLG